MNDDAFEDKLRALTAKLERPDPTPGWKADILVRAAQARDRQAPHTPRWLLATLGTAWVLIALLRLTTPDNTSTLSAALPATAFTEPHANGETSWRALMAFQSNSELPELP